MFRRNLTAHNRWICGSLTLAQILQGETSLIPGTLGVIVDFGRGGMRDDEL